MITRFSAWLIKRGYHNAFNWLCVAFILAMVVSMSAELKERRDAVNERLEKIEQRLNITPPSSAEKH